MGGTSVPASDALIPLNDGPELFIGLIAPLGVDTNAVTDALKGALAAVNYKSEVVRMSGLLKGIGSVAKTLPNENAPENERIEGYMDAADKLREQVGSGSVLVHLAMAWLQEERPKDAKGRPGPRHRTAYIFSTLKHPDEVQALRKIYGDAFFAVSVYSPPTARVDWLKLRIAQQSGGSPEDQTEVAERLVQKDAEAPDRVLGQNVEDTFPLGDVFVRGDDPHVRQEIDRFIDILFSHPYRTPSIDECGMFQAKAASLRSADLSRQVGAAICDTEGSIVAIGCNEVPKAGGGMYWEGDDPDRRDFREGSDPNALAKRAILSELLDSLRQWLTEELAQQPADKIASTVLKAIKGTRITKLLEFGRVVHAEMNALMDAARRGVSVRGATLYCTTLPCHVCARHVLAAGVARVVYIEPYPKSMLEEMYRGSMCMHGQAGDERALRFDAFVGIAPSRFIDCFESGVRKDKSGFAARWVPGSATLRFRSIVETHIEKETTCAAQLLGVKQTLGLLTDVEA